MIRIYVPIQEVNPKSLCHKSANRRRKESNPKISVLSVRSVVKDPPAAINV